SPTMLCGPRIGTVSSWWKSSQAIPAFSTKLKIAAPTPCSSTRNRRCAGDMRPLIAYSRWRMSREGAKGPAVVIGGGIAGLAAARVLARHYARVVVLERDRRAPVASPEEAFTRWERPGVAQFRHSHAFLARLRLLLLAHFPDVLDRLRDVGAREIGLAEAAPPGLVVAPRADDEDVVLLACRRATFEWAFRASVVDRPGIELHEGARVAGLV